MNYDSNKNAAAFQTKTKKTSTLFDTVLYAQTKPHFSAAYNVDEIFIENNIF